MYRCEPGTVVEREWRIVMRAFARSRTKDNHRNTHVAFDGFAFLTNHACSS
ncbi:hypothetical protein BSLA_02r2908 [Burkholderia stabilis]|nr:hypothetical protein BSLA_02r2908 [Burkholderia stabilis]